MEVKIDSKDVDEYLIKPLAYIYSEYTSFADELTKVLINQFPWFRNILSDFAVVKPLFFYRMGMTTRVYNTIDKCTLSFYVHEALSKVKDKVPTSLLDPIAEVIEKNVPAIFLWETLGISIMNLISKFTVVSDELKNSMGRVRKIFTEKEGKRRKVIKKIMEALEPFPQVINVLRNAFSMEPIPEREPPKIEVGGYLRYVREYSGVPSEINTIDGLLIYSIKIEGMFYPLKYALLNAFAFLQRFLNNTQTFINYLIEGTQPSEEELNEIGAMLGVATYLSSYSRPLSTAKRKFRELHRPEEFSGAGGYKIYEEFMKDYSKMRKKNEVKLKDMREPLHRAVAFLG